MTCSAVPKGMSMLGLGIVRGDAETLFRRLTLDQTESYGVSKDQLPDGWAAERFKVFNGGEGRIGFYNKHYNKHLGL